MAILLMPMPVMAVPPGTAGPRPWPWPWLPGAARRMEFVAGELAELTQPVVHFNPRVRFAAPRPTANLIGRNRLFSRRRNAYA